MANPTQPKPTMDKDEATVVNGPATQGPATTDGKPASAASVDKKEPRYVAVTMFPALLEALRKAAAGKALGGYVQDVLCRELNITSKPVKAARVKYATAEEKKAALVQRRKDHAAEVAEALKMLRELRAKQAAEAAQSA